MHFEADNPALKTSGNAQSGHGWNPVDFPGGTGAFKMRTIRV